MNTFFFRKKRINILLRIIFFYQIVILLIFIGSCTEQKNQNAKKLIPEKKLIPLIVDIHKIDAYMTLKMNDSLCFEPKKINDAVLKRHKVSREEFNKTIIYYSQNLPQFDSLYEKILVKMSEMKAETMDKNKDLNKKK